MIIKYLKKSKKDLSTVMNAYLSNIGYDKLSKKNNLTKCDILLFVDN